MSDQQNLGPVGIWQVKNFPDALRRAIVERAMVEKVTVSELLTRIMVAVIEADWQVGDAVNPSATQSTHDDLTKVERVIAAAVSLSSARGIPVDLRKDANRLLRESLPSLPQPAEAKPLRLTDEAHPKANGVMVDSENGLSA